MKKTILAFLITSMVLFAGYLKAQSVVGPFTGSCNTILNYIFVPAANSTCATVLWTAKFPDGSVQYGSGSGFTINSGSMPGDITVSANAYNCTEVFSGGSGLVSPSQSASRSTTVGDGRLSTPSSLSGPSLLCDGSTGSYTVSAVSGAGSYTFTVPPGWRINEMNTTSLEVTGTRTVTIGSPSGSGVGKITVKANPSNPCSSSSYARSIRVAYGKQQPVISTSSTQRPVNSLAEFSVDGLGLSNIQWIIPSSWTVVTGANSPTVTTITSNIPDDYLIEVTARSCGKTVANFLEVEIIPGSGGGTFFRTAESTKKPAEMIELEGGVTLYPNPVSSVMQMRFHEQKAEIETMTLISLTDGRKVLERKPDDQFSIDLSDVDNGLYMITFVLKSGKKIQKRIQVLHESVTEAY